MGISGSRQRTTSTSNSTSQPNVPGFISQPYQNFASQLSNMMSTYGNNPSTVGATPLQTQAFNGARSLGSNASALTDAQNQTRGLFNFTPSNVTAGQLSDVDMGRYMDPYQSGVIDSLMSDFSYANDLGLNSLRSMTPTGAYGGSRQMVAAGQLVGDNTRALTSTLANLRSQGYQNAQNAAMFDIGNRYNADTFNSQQGLAGANFRLGAANQLGTMGLAGDANSRANLTTQADLGAQERGIAQENDPMQSNMRYLAQIAALLSGGLSGYPIGQTVNSTGTNTTTSSPSMVSQLGTALQLGGYLFSDRYLKRDIEPTGEAINGTPVYDFAYLWDPPGVRRRGVMADEAPPHAVAVHEPTGFLLVDMGAL